MSRLALGTVQFGLKYGITNLRGQPSLREAGEILEVAREYGIDLLDSAVVYGISEKVLGHLGVTDFKIVTKLPPIPDGTQNVVKWVELQLRSSLKRLRLDSIYGLLLHRSRDLTGQHGNELALGIQNIKASGLVSKVGVSIYDPSELDETLSRMAVDLVQAPMNLVDRRLEKSGWLRKLHSKGVEVHTRSTFLQGLLIVPREKVPVQFERWSSLWDCWHRELRGNSASAIASCLAYPLSLPEVSRVVVGVDVADQLKSLVMEAQNLPNHQKWPSIVSNDPILINPSNWNQL